MAQSASFDGYQINRTNLVLTGTIGQGEIRQILGEEDLTNIVKLKLNSCNATRLDLGKLKEQLIKLQEIKIVGMKLNTALFDLLKHTNVTRLTFERCEVSFSHKAFNSLVKFKKLAQVDIREAGLNALDKRMLKAYARNVQIIGPSHPKPIFDDNRGGVRRERTLPPFPKTPKAVRTKRPRVRR